MLGLGEAGGQEDRSWMPRPSHGKSVDDGVQIVANLRRMMEPVHG